MDRYMVIIISFYLVCMGDPIVPIVAYDIRLLSKCEPVRTKFCSSMYNQTHLDRSQDDAILDLKQYQELDFLGCAEHLKLFLCGTFLPMCTVLDKPLVPCRSLCEEVKAGCEKILMKYTDLPWPTRLRCSQYPVDGPKTICIGKNKKKEKKVIVNKVPPNRRTRIVEDESVLLKCKGLQKINLKRIVHENADCNRAVSQQVIGKLCNTEHTCEFRLKSVANAPGQLATCIPGRIGKSIIKYQCTTHNQAKKMILQYGQDDNLYCKSATRNLVITKVQFKDDTCISPNAFCSVSQSCTGKRQCALWANNNFLQSPCQGTNIKLVVHYECVKNRKSEELQVTKNIEDGVTLQCPPNKTISIVRAQYISNYCRTKQIHCAVSLRCEKKRYCKLTRFNLLAVKCTESLSKIHIRYICS